MYYYLTYTSDDGSTRKKIWEIIERKQRGWCKLAWTHFIDDDVISQTPADSQTPGYVGRLVKLVVAPGVEIETVKIFAPMGMGGRDDWHYTFCADTLEDVV